MNGPPSVDSGRRIATWKGGPKDPDDRRLITVRLGRSQLGTLMPNCQERLKCREPH